MAVDVRALLHPRSIAVVGATEASSWAQALLANLELYGYAGALHLVHPRHGEQFGRPCAASLLEVPGEVDLAYVMTGTAAAEQVIEDCGRKGVRSAVMLTAGFRETGAEGAERERRLAGRCAELGITMLGPNCLGFVNHTARVPAYALTLPSVLPPGRVAIASQSGAMLLHLHRLAHARGAGLARLVSIGNEAVVSAADVLESFVEDPEVAVLGALLEGFRDPRRFLEVARRALDAGKPLVVLKVGGSPVGRRSAAAHTGSLAGEDRVVDAVLRQHGAVRVGTLEELLETCSVLDRQGWPRGRRTAVITTSGGACSLVSDLAVGTRLDIADFAPVTKARLTELLPDFGTPQNPLDTTGVIVNQPGLLAACVDAVVAEGAYEAFLVNTDPPRTPGLSPGLTEERVNALAGALGRVPVFWALASTAAVDLTEYGRDAMSRHGLYCSSGLHLGVRAVDGAIRYGELAARRRPRRQPEARRLEAPGAGVLNEAAAKRLLGLPAPAERAVSSAAEAAAAGAELGLPCVVKVLSADIPHKSRIGAVQLEVTDPAAAFQAVVDAARRAQPEARVEGALVVARVEGAVAELIAGVSRDEVFGPVVVAGLGGVFAEVLDDVALRLPPLDREEALCMLAELRGARLLEGGDLDAAADALVVLGDLALDLGDRLQAIDVNPLFLMPAGQGVLAGDALVELR